MSRTGASLGEGAYAYFRTGSFASGARLVNAISELPGVDDHQPDVDMRHDGVTVRLITTTGDWYGMSRRDVELARQISAAARELGLSGRPVRGPEPCWSSRARQPPPK